MTTDFGNLNAQQIARVKVLEAADPASATAAEKRELADLLADSKLKVAPTKGYTRTGDPTVYVEETVVKVKLVALKKDAAAPANIEELSVADFEKRFDAPKQVIAPAPKPTKAKVVAEEQA